MAPDEAEIAATKTQLLRDFASYVRRFHDGEVRTRFAPVAWVGPVRR